MVKLDLMKNKPLMLTGPLSMFFDASPLQKLRIIVSSMFVLFTAAIVLLFLSQIFFTVSFLALAYLMLLILTIKLFTISNL